MALRGKAPWLVFALVLLAAILLRIPGITSAKTLMDEGSRIALGAAVSEGEVIYRDVIEFGPPGPILLNAAILRYVADSVVAVRVAYLIVSLLSLCLISLIAARLFGRWYGVVTGALFAVSPFEVVFSYHAMTEPLMVLFVLAAVALIVRAELETRLSRYALGGLLCFCAGLFKQPGLLTLLALGLAIVWWSRETGRWRAGLARGAAMMAGAGCGFAIWSALMVHQGIWAGWWANMTVFHGGASVGMLHDMFGVTPPTDPDKWAAWITDYLCRRPFVAMGVLGLFFTARRGPAMVLLRSAALILAVFVMLLPLSFGNNLGFTHYLLMVEPWWMLLSAGFLARFVEHARGLELAFGKRQLSLLLIPALLVVAALQFADLVSLRRQLAEQGTIEQQRREADELVGYGSVLVLSNAVNYYFSDTEPPCWPYQYFLHFQVLSLERDDPAELEHRIVEHVEAANAILVDRKRWQVVGPLLEREGLVPDWRLSRQIGKQRIWILERRRPRES